MHAYEICPRKNHRGFDLLSGLLTFDSKTLADLPVLIEAEGK
jgi:hypothetical protein